MLILPYIHKVTTYNSLYIHVIRILTIGGKILWEEDDSLDLQTEILIPNDIYSTSKICKINDVVLLEIDLEKTNINNIYKWSELNITDTETFCWRDYIYIIGSNHENWLNISEKELIGNISLKSLILKILENNN